MISHTAHPGRYGFSSPAIHRRPLLAILLLMAAVSLLPSTSHAQQPMLTDDAYTSSAKPSKNFGDDASVLVSGAANTGLLKFKLTPSLPPGTVGGHVGKATLKIFIDSVTTPGSLSVYRVTGAWAEESVTGATAPALGSLETTVSVNASQAGKWLTVDLTQLVKDWLNNALPNNGVAVVAGPGGAVLTFDSKENGATSHEARLEVVLNHAATADRAAEADHATSADSAVSAAAADSLAAGAIVSGSQVAGDIPGRASSITGVVRGDQVSGAVAESTHAASAETAANAVTADAARGAASAAGDADIASPTAGQFYFNTTLKVFRQYDGAVWKTVDAGLANQLSSAGTLNSPTNPVDWTQLKNVPANAAQGYSAGTGVSINASNSISNTGVLSVGVSAPLAATGGPQNPTILLSGTVQVANGGTGFDSAGPAGSFLRSDGSAWTRSTLLASDVPAGSASYIQNSGAQQSGASFNISGNGTLGGGLSANSVNAATQYSIAGQRVLSAPGLSSNIYVGLNAGNPNAAVGMNNSFFGFNAGPSNTTGTENSFFGSAAGFSNTTGFGNSFFGVASGNSNTSGSDNSFFGFGAGQHSTQGGNNSFFGVNAGLNNTTGPENSFVGALAGSQNTTGGFNTFVGRFAGLSNTAESNNTFIGTDSNGAPGITNATAVGSHAQVTQSNSLVLGSIGGVNNTGADTNVGIGTTAPTQRLEVKGNVKISGAGSGLIFPDGTTQSSASSGTATDLACAGCVSVSKLAFDPATEAELMIHIASGDHDGRYSLLGHTHNVSEVSGAATLGANSFSGTQNVAGDLNATGTLNGASATFGTSLSVGSRSTGGTIFTTNTINRFAEIGSNVNFDSFGTAPGIRLRAADPGLPNPNTWGLILGDGDGHYGSFIIRQDDMSVGGGFTRNRFIIARNGDVIVNSGRLGVGNESPSARLDVAGDARASGNVTAASFRGDGSGLTNVSAVASSNLNCAGCVSEAELDFDPATQTELNAHKTSDDHDGRYSRLAHTHNVSEVANAATLGANNFAGGQNVNGNVRISGAGNGLTFPDGSTQFTAALGGLSNVASTGSNVSAEVSFSAPANYETIPDMAAAGVSAGPAGKAVVIGHVSISALSTCDVFRLRLAVDGTLVPQWQHMVRDCAEQASGAEGGPSIVSVSFMAVVTLSPGQHTVELKVGSEDGSSRRFQVYTRDMSLLLF